MDDDSTSVTLAAGAGAFGDGSHPTTRGVLAALEAIDPDAFAPRIACDMGAGSGILSFALARLFRCPVVAVDSEASAVETLRQNAEQNGLSEYILPIHNVGFTHPAIAANGPYDIIVMNILADPLLALAHDANHHLAPEGALILSGLLAWQEPPIREAYQALGLELTSRLTLQDWVTLTWQKP